MKPMSASPDATAAPDFAAVSYCSSSASTPSICANRRVRSMVTPAGRSAAVRLWARTGLPMLRAARRRPVGANSRTREGSICIASGYRLLPAAQSSLYTGRFTRSETCWTWV